MKIEQIYTGCLAEAAYYIESQGEVAIIDPLRETEPYIQKAKENDAKIKYIFETHFHADFVSGHIDLAKKTGGTIVYGPKANTAYEIYQAKDEEIFELGEVKIKVLHTPGHTPESTTFLLIDENGKDHAIFTGDTLFIGDVGRPDLAIKSDVTQEDLASMLYDSLHNKIMPLSDEVIVYPGHGAGSACGKNMSKETFDTLGNQKKVNYALQATTRENFIKEVTTGLTPPPQYFAKNAMMNKTGYESFDEVMEQGTIPLDPALFEDVVNRDGALMLDTRSEEAFAKGHIPNSIFIGIDGGFAPWVGTLITDIQQPIVIITEAGREEEVVTRLARVGYDNTLGYLQGGFQAWVDAGKDVESIESISPQEFAQRMKVEDLKVLDVRKYTEYFAERVEGAENFPLDYINQNMHQLNRNETYYVHCLGGYRSMITASILQARGFQHIIDIQGGFRAIAETDVTKTDYVCPSTIS